MSRSRAQAPSSFAPSDSQRREPLQHGWGQSELATAARSGRKAARGRLTYSSRPPATHPQRPRASRPGAPEATPVRARPARPGWGQRNSQLSGRTVGTVVCPRMATSLL